MSRKVQIRVELTIKEYDAVKLVAGGATNVPDYVRKALLENLDRWLKSPQSTSSSNEPTTKQL
jgi:hypothetical protein